MTYINKNSGWLRSRRIKHITENKEKGNAQMEVDVLVSNDLPPKGAPTSD